MSTENTNNVNTILSNNSGRCIELLHHSYDPAVWIVQRSKKILWFRWNKSMFYFYSKQQALNFAHTQAVEKTLHKRNETP